MPFRVSAQASTRLRGGPPPRCAAGTAAPASTAPINTAAAVRPPLRSRIAVSSEETIRQRASASDAARLFAPAEGASQLVGKRTQTLLRLGVPLAFSVLLNLGRFLGCANRLDAQPDSAARRIDFEDD